MNDLDDDAQQIKHFIELVKTSRKILLVTHKNPDFDAIGSILAMFYILEAFGVKEIKMNIEGLEKIPKNYFFLPNIERIDNQDLGKIIDKYDFLIFLDGNKLYRFTQDLEILPELKKIAIFDHHPGEIDIKYDFLFRNVFASSTCEVIAKSFRNENLITADIATLLIAGIYADSKNFTINKVTANTFDIMSFLLNSGGNKEKFINNGFRYNDKILNALKSFLNNLKFDTDKKYSYTYISRDLYDMLNLNSFDINIIQNYMTAFLINNSEYNWGFLVRPINENEFKVSFRSNTNGINVRLIAEKLSGGGHDLASGATIQAEDAYEALSIVRNKIDEILAQQTKKK